MKPTGKAILINYPFNSTNTSSSTYSYVSYVGHVTLTVLGDTMINSVYNGKRYKIIDDSDWNINAYSYLDSTQTWYLITLNGGSEKKFLDMAFKLPLLANSSYTAGINSNTETYTVGYPDCLNVSNATYQAFSITQTYSSSFPYMDIRQFNLNTSGLVSWDYIQTVISTQDGNFYDTIWLFERIN